MNEQPAQSDPSPAEPRLPDQQAQREHDREELEPSSPESLADQGDLVDDEGDDIREYTGEPVETEDGWVVPQQQNVGSDNMAGGGEWPDKDTPPVQPDH